MTLWHSPWWWIALFCCFGGVTASWLLARHAFNKEKQAQRLSRYITETGVNSSDNAKLFSQTQQQSWQLKERQKLNTNLTLAGFYHHHALRYLIATKLCLATLALLLSVYLLNIDSILWCFAAAVVANMMPDFALSYCQRKQKRMIAKALPEHLDLLIICLNSGLSIERGLKLVSTQLADLSPALSLQWQLCLAQLQVNPDRNAAWAALAVRNQSTDIDAFVDAITQAERYGSPLVETLRTFTAQIRNMRSLHLEEKIAKLSSVIALPMLLLVFMPLMVIMLAPQISLLMSALKGLS